MKEVAKVVKTEQDYSVVYVEKKDECSKCGMCLFPQNAKGVEINAVNHIDARVGDTVIIELSEKGKLLGVFLAFVVPLLFIGISFLVNALTFRNDIFTLVLVLCLVVVWYLILPLIDKKITEKKDYRAQIISLINDKKINNIENN